MTKYMSAGRHGLYPDNDFSELELNLDVSRHRMRNGDHDRDRYHNRQKDTKERELMNGGYRSVSSRSDSGRAGSSGGVAARLCDISLRAGEREPGELLSGSVSDEDIDSESQGKEKETLKLENRTQLLQRKKRKFSPILWGRDEDSKLHSSEPLVDIVSYVSAAVESPAGLFSSPLQEQRSEYSEDVDYLKDEVYAPLRNIRSSRWTNDANFPADEGEFSDAPAERRILKWRKKISIATPVEMRAHKKSISPEFGEVKREGFEGTRARSSESDEGGTRSRSSSRNGHSDNDLDMKNNMEINKELNNGGTRLSHADTESKDECDSHDSPEPAGPPQRSVGLLQGCRSVDDFERLNKIDEGTYGVVFRAKDKKTGEIVALKKVKMEKEREGFPLTSLREINILLSFDHPSIVDVKEVVVGSSLDKIFMVMEYMEHDLKALMETKKQPFSQSEVKCLMLQLLEGVKYLHNNWVLHRDLRTSNLLLNNCGELKICDFGLARQYGSPLKSYTHLVVTLWYRAPELLLGAKQYSTAIDMWSLGCVMAELLSNQPLFNGKTEVDQIDKIFRMLGTPNETIWPGFSKLPGVKANFVKHPYNLLRKKFPATSFVGSPVLSDAGFDLLNKLLTYTPEKRITAADAINHQWFREVPLPKSKDFMPIFPAQHAQDRRMRRIMKSPDPLEELRRKELLCGGLGTGGFFD